MGMRRGGWKPPLNVWLQRNAENIYKKNAWRAARVRLKENSAPQAEIAQQPEQHSCTALGKNKNHL